MRFCPSCDYVDQQDRPGLVALHHVLGSPVTHHEPGQHEVNPVDDRIWPPNDEPSWVEYSVGVRD